jgi:hypothetical protein
MFDGLDAKALTIYLYIIYDARYIYNVKTGRSTPPVVININNQDWRRRKRATENKTILFLFEAY